MRFLCKATIHSAALWHNLRRVRDYAPHSQILAMVKANAYGHGLIPVARLLSDAGADALGVARVSEGILLRNAGITLPIVLCEGIVHLDDLAWVEKHHFSMVVHQFWQLALIEQTPMKHPLKIWIKVDTGMHRLGFFPEEISTVIARLAHCAWVDPEFGLMTHFAQADCLEQVATSLQIKVFDKVRPLISGPASLANSAAIIAWPHTHQQWVRPGLMLYGISPFPEQVAHDHHLLPAMTLTSEIIALRRGRKGDAIGYGGTWVCPEDMPIGVVAIGYGDGYPRYIQNGTPVFIEGTLVPVIGRVSMDMITVDLRLRPEVTIGTPVTLWGENLPVEVIARWANTSAYELVCGLTKRVYIHWQ